MKNMNTGFTEHIINITRRFIAERWPLIVKKKQHPYFEVKTISKKEKIKKIQEILATEYIQMIKQEIKI